MDIEIYVTLNFAPGLNNTMLTNNFRYFYTLGRLEGKLAVFGGEFDTDKIEVYDEDTNTWNISGAVLTISRTYGQKVDIPCDFSDIVITI